MLGRGDGKMKRITLICVMLWCCIGMAAAAEQKTAEAFLSKCATKADEALKADTMTVVGKDGFLFFGTELHHVSVGKFWGPEAVKVSKATKPEWADPLPAILDFKSQLDKAGIELIFVPVPAKTLIYADKLSDKAPLDEAGFPVRMDARNQEFFKLLTEKGVKVIDLMPVFLPNARTTPRKVPSTANRIRIGPAVPAP